MAPSETKEGLRPSNHRGEDVPEKMKALQYEVSVFTKVTKTDVLKVFCAGEVRCC